MDAHTTLLLACATISAGGAVIAGIQAERAARAESQARHGSGVALDAADRAERADANTGQRVAELRELAGHHMQEIAPLIEALTDLQTRLTDAAPPPRAMAEPARGSPEYWRALDGRAMLDRNGTRLTVRYDGGDSIIVTPKGGSPEHWHRLSAAALDLMPVEASATLPTALPPQGTGA
jgi:hypothetical protein